MKPINVKLIVLVIQTVKAALNLQALLLDHNAAGAPLAIPSTTPQEPATSSSSVRVTNSRMVMFVCSVMMWLMEEKKVAISVMSIIGTVEITFTAIGVTMITDSPMDMTIMATGSNIACMLWVKEIVLKDVMTVL